MNRPRLEPSSFFNVIEQVRLAWRLMRDGRIPLQLKLLPLLTAAYVIFPVDVLPDLIPGLGQIDDLAALILGVRLLIDLAPRDLVDEHLADIRGLSGAGPRSDSTSSAHSGVVIEADFRPVEEKRDA